jgi:DNA-binding FadR family transcriptional regulator
MSAGKERVVRALVTDVVDGRLRPGERLPEDAQLARRFGVSLEVARAALGDLDARGIADGRGLVRPEAEWNVLDPGVVEVMLGSGQGAAILAEYLEYRRIVEVVAAGLAAENATADDLTALSDSLAAMTAASEMPASMDAEARFHDADVAFHQALVAAGRNRPLEQATDTMRPALCAARRVLARPEARLDRGLPEHRRILAAVAQGDADAARDAMSRHLDSVESYLRDYVGLTGRTSETSSPTD